MRREPAGRPTGGRFAPTRRPEGDDLDLPGAAESAVARFDAAAVEPCRSEVDGALLVQIDTGPLSGRRVRVVLNDGDLFDGDPELDETPGQQVARLLRRSGRAESVEARAALYEQIRAIHGL